MMNVTISATKKDGKKLSEKNTKPQNIKEATTKYGGEEALLELAWSTYVIHRQRYLRDGSPLEKFLAKHPEHRKDFAK